MQKKVAVIDIGSNTIKLLVAKRSANKDILDTLHRHTLETRIGQGLSGETMRFSPDVIEKASSAIATLVREADPFSPDATRVVATSAARDAENSRDLADAIQAKTDLPLEILSGEQEADFIGRAIQMDPKIHARNLYVFDLGGGSLECLRFENRKLDRVVSLPLGCVRLAEKLLADQTAVFTPDDERRVGEEVERVIKESGFTFSLPPGSITVGTGGTLSTALNIMAAEQNQRLEDVDPYLSREDLGSLLAMTGALPLTERLLIERLSRGRADVFPTALAVFLKILDLTGAEGMHHSLLNLRYGLAAEMLDELESTD